MKPLFAHLFALLLLASSAVDAQDATDCGNLADLQLADVRLESVEWITPGEDPDISKPACKVLGVIGTEVGFELLLPEEWNGRFFMGGGGGYVGVIQNHMRTSVNDGYATVGTDTGHKGGILFADWAYKNEERRVNFGHIAVHRTAEVAKEIIRSYYASEIAFSYFGGCSRGGGQATMEAQRYPDDFDGIVAGAPAMDWTGFAAEFVQNVQLNFPNPADVSEPVITEANLSLLEARILSMCDGLDGVEDGVLADPRECPFQLGQLAACTAEMEGPECLTSAQRAAIQRIYAPVSNANGEIAPGQPFGSEATQGGWPQWITGSASPMAPNGQWIFGTQFFKYFVFDDPEWDYTSYDFSTWAEDTRHAGTYMNSTNPDLSALKDNGGKLILWHGWSDPALTAERSIEYYEEVKAHDSDINDYFRMYLMPGVLHCGSGPGPDQADWVDAITTWVEQGVAPERIIAAKKDGDEIVRTRPLCPYPQKAVYSGSGSTDEEASFVCE